MKKETFNPKFLGDGKSAKAITASELDLIPWESGDESFAVQLHAKEFTSLCPVTSEPDFAELEVVYYPDKFLVETKSFKHYLQSFRNVGEFNEKLCQRIAAELFEKLSPSSIHVKMIFNYRGGINVTAKADLRKIKELKK